MDGEAFDNVTLMPKPRIKALPGFLVATAEKCLDVSLATYELLERTKFRTPLGNICIIRIIDAGNVLIAGPSKINEMDAVVKKMQGLGAERVFIDGAFSRGSPARLATATILVIGANRSPIMETVLKDAEASVLKLSLKRVSKKLEYLARQDLITAVDDSGNLHHFEGDSTIVEPEKVFAWIQDSWRYLYVPNAVGCTFLKLMAKDRRKQYSLIMNDPSSLQIGDSLDKLIGRLTDRLMVLRPVNLIAVCVNPTSPRGYAFDEAIFRKELGIRLNLEVTNVMIKAGDDNEQTES